MEKPALQDQIKEAKIGARVEYAEALLRFMDGEASPELAHELCDPSIFIKRDSKKLYVEIVASYINGKPIDVSYVREPEKIPALAHLAALDLIEVEEQPFLYFFRRKTIVPKRKDWDLEKTEAPEGQTEGG